MAGVVAQARMQMTRRGRMMVVTLDDARPQVELTVFSELFETARDKIKEDALLVVAGKVQRDEFSGGLRVSADEILDLEGLRARFAARLRIAMNGEADAKRLQQVLRPTAPPAVAPARSSSPTAIPPPRAKSRSAMRGVLRPTAASSPSSAPG